MAKQKKKGVQTPQQQPAPTYKNMRMMSSMRTQQGDQRQASSPTTKRDTLNYNRGFQYGLKNKAPKNGLPGEGSMFKGGRWEGQNNAASVNQLKKQVKKTKNSGSFGSVLMNYLTGKF